MKPVFCTIGGSMRNVCHIRTEKSIYPESWPYDPKQTQCESIEAIRKYIEDTKMEFVMFGVRSNGIPNRAVSVNDAEKLDKALKKFEKVLNHWGER
jgi:hypothetical protein